MLLHGVAITDESGARGPSSCMTFPVVTEIPPRLEPVERDDFLGEPPVASPSLPPRRRPLDA